MFITLQGLWANRANNGMTEVMLDRAVAKGWVTTEQKVQIMAQ